MSLPFFFLNSLPYNIMSKEQFEIATFSSDTSPSEVLEGGLSFSTAVSKAKKLWKSGKEYGVMVVSQSPDSLEPIQWIMSKSAFIEDIPLAK